MNEVKERVQISDTGFGENMKLYNTVLGDLLEQKAPLQKLSVKVVSSAPWFDTEYKELRRQRRKAEKTYKKTRSLEDKEKFTKLRKQTTQLAHNKKCKHYSDKLEGSNRHLFSSINKLLDNEQEEVLPEADSDRELASRFLKYFTEKIEKIRQTFPEDTTDINLRMSAPAGKLMVFEEATEEEIREIVVEYGTKCSPEDPIPASLLKKVDMDVFIPIWTKLVKTSEKGVFAGHLN